MEYDIVLPNPAGMAVFVPVKTSAITGSSGGIASGTINSTGNFQERKNPQQPPGFKGPAMFFLMTMRFFISGLLR
jgi:hypothetical protein